MYVDLFKLSLLVLAAWCNGYNFDPHSYKWYCLTMSIISITMASNSVINDFHSTYNRDCNGNSTPFLNPRGFCPRSEGCANSSKCAGFTTFPEDHLAVSS